MVKGIALLAVAASLATAFGLMSQSDKPVRATAVEIQKPIDVDAQLAATAPSTIEVAPVVIVAKMARKVAHAKQIAECGAFDFRPLTQGVGSVRGFCGGGL